MTILLLTAVVSAVSFPAFVPPPEGIGSETFSVSGRAFGMGGVNAGLTDSTSLSSANPAASAWADRTGVYFGGVFRRGDDPAWDGRPAFPYLSILFPLPGRVVLSGYFAGKSQVSSRDTLSVDEFIGKYHWTGGLGEAYTGVSVLASEWLAFSLGGRCTFGNVTSDVQLSKELPGPLEPLNYTYRDDARFLPSWGAMLGMFINTPSLDLGFAITTDRSGDLEIARDYLATGSDSTSEGYTIPGELSVGLSVRPLSRLTLAADLFVRKRLTILEASVDNGTVISTGAEVNLGNGFAARGGYSVMNGLWRDGSVRYTVGGSYSFGGGRARVDIGIGHEIWDDDLGETSLYVCLWASERWLGR